jgi:hypothetical protein
MSAVKVSPPLACVCDGGSFEAAKSAGKIAVITATQRRKSRGNAVEHTGLCEKEEWGELQPSSITKPCFNPCTSLLCV